MNDKKLHMREFLCATGESTAPPLPCSPRPPCLARPSPRPLLATPYRASAQRSARPPNSLRFVGGRAAALGGRSLRGVAMGFASASGGVASLRLRGGRCLRLWLGACRWVCWFGCFCVVWVCWFGCFCVVWVCWFGCLCVVWVGWFGCLCVVWVCWFGCLCVVWVCWFGCLLCGFGGMVCFISFRGGWVFSFSCWRCG